MSGSVASQALLTRFSHFVLLKICKIAFIACIAVRIYLVLSFSCSSVRRRSFHENLREEADRGFNPRARRDHGSKNALAKPFSAL